MTRSNEYLQLRGDLTEQALLALGDVIRAHFPATDPQIRAIGESWTHAVHQLDAKYSNE